MSAPKLSVVVVLYDMQRAARRTLHSLTPSYQRGLCESDYEVIVVDNGSPQRLAKAVVDSLPANFRYIYFEEANPSPAKALNFAVSQSRSSQLGLFIDGARILTPGLLRHALNGFRIYEKPVLTALTWHLGPDIQNRSVKAGFNEDAENRLLQKINWPRAGYRLFEISTLAGSSSDGWFSPNRESSSLFINRRTFEELGGYDESFNLPGGGLLNMDIYNRACELSDTELVMILGEGTFHQLHGGVSTSVSEEELAAKLDQWARQYFAIRGREISPPVKQMEYIGHIPTEALDTLRYSIDRMGIERSHRESPR